MGPRYKIFQPNSIILFSDPQSILQTSALKTHPPRWSQKHLWSYNPKRAVAICLFTMTNSLMACALVSSFRKRNLIILVTGITLSVFYDI